jgi:hypothetical protein
MHPTMRRQLMTSQAAAIGGLILVKAEHALKLATAGLKVN